VKYNLFINEEKQNYHLIITIVIIKYASVDGDYDALKTIIIKKYAIIIKFITVIIIKLLKVDLTHIFEDVTVIIMPLLVAYLNLFFILDEFA
jgi:hypothetical protein